jgi:hypothetical protein
MKDMKRVMIILYTLYACINFLFIMFAILTLHMILAGISFVFYFFASLILAKYLPELSE